MPLKPRSYRTQFKKHENGWQATLPDISAYRTTSSLITGLQEGGVYQGWAG
jgi:hypothetical protein